MSSSLDCNHRALRIAGAVLAVLMISVVVANVLWPGPPPPADNQPRMPPSQSPFPTFALAPVLHAAPMDADANLSMRILMTALQGIVNRLAVELYLDVPAGAARGPAQSFSDPAGRLHTEYGL